MTTGEGDELADVEYEKKVLGKFFEEDKFSKKRLLELVDLLSNYVKVNPKTGEVFVIRKDLPDRVKVGLVIVARFVAHRLNESISPEINREEIADFTGIAENIVSARALELIKEGVISRPSRGTFMARSLVSIERWLEGVVKKYGGD